MDNNFLGQKIPKLGFGLMRLPMLGGDVDLEQTKKMVDRFMAEGFTYFDTAYVYIGGKSEVAAREALVKRYPRDSFQLATKLPVWEAKTPEDMQRIFNVQLEQAQGILISTCFMPWITIAWLKPKNQVPGNLPLISKQKV
jgi:predicted aldo/keto reductase-like oxidoreductase